MTDTFTISDVLTLKAYPDKSNFVLKFSVGESYMNYIVSATNFYKIASYLTSVKYSVEIGTKQHFNTVVGFKMGFETHRNNSKILHDEVLFYFTDISNYQISFHIKADKLLPLSNYLNQAINYSILT